MSDLASERFSELRKTNQPIIQSLNHGILLAGFPLASAASRPATETQGPTAQLQKLAAGQEMNTSVRTLQAPILPIDKGARLQRSARTEERRSDSSIPL
jgi:hypothetical protein